MFLTLKDFASYTPKRPTYAIFGAPVRHSLSPELQLAFAEKKGVLIDYLRIEISEEEFPEAMNLAREKLCGFNCTHPFKSLVLKYLDHCDHKVETLRACNTVKVINHSFYGYNTDGDGFVSALSLSGISLKNASVLLLGCGGAAAAIAYEASLVGTNLTIAARNIDKANSFGKRFPGLNYRSVPIADVTGSYDIVINATPVGMASTSSETPVDLSKLDSVNFVYDTIYSPSMTRLLKDAANLGIPYDNGLSMLIFQGAAAQKHWFCHDFTQDEQADVLDKIAVKRAKSRLNGRNVVLSGFMCAGKSTYGRLLANALDMRFLDTDVALEEAFGCSVSKFFANHGEAEFRKREAELVQHIAHESGFVIALGGGAILNSNTATALRENGLVLFLDPPYDLLKERFQHDNTRPLLRASNIEELYLARRPIYEETAHISVRITSEQRALSQLLNYIEGE